MNMAAGQNIQLESVSAYRKPLLVDVFFFTKYYEKVTELLIYGRTCLGKLVYSENSS